MHPPPRVMFANYFLGIGVVGCSVSSFPFFFFLSKAMGPFVYNLGS